MGFTEYLLLAVVIVVPLVIAAAVTLWSLKQVQYRPRKRRPARREPEVPATGSGSAPPPSDQS